MQIQSKPLTAENCVQTITPGKALPLFTSVHSASSSGLVEHPNKSRCPSNGLGNHPFRQSVTKIQKKHQINKSMSIKIQKNIYMSKIIRNFAVINLQKGGLVRLLVAGFFYACTMHIYGVTPVGNCNRTPTAFLGLINGSVTPFFSLPQKHYIGMIKPKNNVRGTKKSNVICTSTGTKAGQSNFSVSENTQGFLECLKMHTALYEKLFKSLEGYWGTEQAEEFMEQTYNEKSEDLYNIIRDFTWDVIDANLHDRTKPGQI